MSQVTGFFHLTMRVGGEESIALAQVHPPGLPGERLLHVLRCEWADRLHPGLSQNRIECLGWEPIEAPLPGWQPLKARSSTPVTIWQQVTAPPA